MFRSFVVLSLAICLSSSMLLPSIANLLDVDFQVTALMDLPEEESQKQAEKELHEKDVFISRMGSSELSGILKNVKQISFCQEVGYAIHSKIHLPPPEQPL